MILLLNIFYIIWNFGVFIWVWRFLRNWIVLLAGSNLFIYFWKGYCTVVKDCKITLKTIWNWLDTVAGSWFACAIANGIVWGIIKYIASSHINITTFFAVLKIELLKYIITIIFVLLNFFFPPFFFGKLPSSLSLFL